MFEFLAILSCLMAMDAFLVSVVSESIDPQLNKTPTTNPQSMEQRPLELKGAHCASGPDISPIC